jgi:hypothetical protein
MFQDEVYRGTGASKHVKWPERIETRRLDLLTRDYFFEVSHHFWHRMSDLVKVNGAGSSRDQRGSDAARGHPVSRGPAVNEHSASGASRTAQATAEGSSSKRRLKDLKHRLKDIRMDTPRWWRLAPRGPDLRGDEEPVASPSR